MIVGRSSEELRGRMKGGGYLRLPKESFAGSMKISVSAANVNDADRS